MSTYKIFCVEKILTAYEMDAGSRSEAQENFNTCDALDLGDHELLDVNILSIEEIIY